MLTWTERVLAESLRTKKSPIKMLYITERIWIISISEYCIKINIVLKAIGDFLFFFFNTETSGLHNEKKKIPKSSYLVYIWFMTTSIVWIMDFLKIHLLQCITKKPYYTCSIVLNSSGPRIPLSSTPNHPAWKYWALYIIQFKSLLLFSARKTLYQSK